MCGIFGYISGDLSKSIIYDKKLLENIQINFEKIQHRGPDTTKTNHLIFHNMTIYI